MPGCAVSGCLNYSRKTKGTDVKYYSFPTNENLCKQWVEACGRSDNLNVKQASICSKHFTQDCFMSSLKHKMLNYQPKKHRDLKSDAIPTELLPDVKPHIKEEPIDTMYNLLDENLIKKEEPIDIEYNLLDESLIKKEEPQFEQPNVNELQKEIIDLKNRNKELEMECQALKNKLKHYKRIIET